MQRCHTLCLTDDPAAVAAFLREIVRLEPTHSFPVTGQQAERLLGWPAGGSDTTIEMYGVGQRPMVEVMEIPPDQRREVPSQFVQVAFTVADLERRVEQCHRLGLSVTDVDRIPLDHGLIAVAYVTVGGVRFELATLESSRSA